MDKLIRVEKKDNVLVVSSREVARDFEKRHDNVMRDIDNLVGNMGSPQNWGHLFYRSKYTDSMNRAQNEYLMSRDGFSLLSMGFTGQKALQWKLKYIDAFNKMESTIKHQQKQLIDLTKQHNSQARLKNAKVREAKLLLQIADKAETPREYKQILNSYAIEIVTGERLLPLPVTEEKTYTATEIAKELGSTANMIGRLANKNNLKISDYGIEVWDKSKYSSKQIPSWRYNEIGKSKIIQLFEEAEETP